MKSLEFELPLVATIFLLIIMIVYFVKKRANFPENKMFSVILICSFIESIIDTFIHVICAFNSFDDINTKYYEIINYSNKILAILFVIIFTSYFVYILMITFDSIKKNFRKINIASVILYVIVFFILQFTSVELVEINTVTNVSGGMTIIISYLATFISLLASLAITLKNIGSRDKRYFSVYFITVMLLLFVIITKQIPGIIFYDIALALMCYVMYFTIENPDVKMVQALELARNQADKANRAKTEFLSSMSHEIRTPLNAISGFSDCILDEAKENAKDIVDASGTLLDIVNGILDISKIEAGKLEIVNSPYNAPDTFNELAKLITPKMKEKGLDFTYYIAPDLPKILRGDPANLKKIVTNILSNACKYTKTGFVRYEVNCVNMNGYTRLIISVEDSGQGIKKENINKLFTRFQRLEEDKNTTIEGTGLGLAITKQLTELMGGKIIVHSIYGTGSKFTVVLNQKIETKEIVPEHRYKTTLNLKDIKILMVDDTALNLKVATKLLKRHNANNITTCESGFDCISRIGRGEKYDIILLDDMMPKMSGVETLKKLKNMPGFNIPIVALTANAITGMKEHYLSEGFNSYLAKPIQDDELIRTLNEVLGRTATEQIPVVDKEEKVEEFTSKDDIIPIEDDIEVELGDKLDISTTSVENKNSSNVEMLDNKISYTKYDVNYLKENDIDVDESINSLGDINIYNMTISAYLDEVENRWERIVKYKNSNDMTNYSCELHSLKSSSKYIGLTKLSDIAYQHELKSKDYDSNFVNNHFSELENQYLKDIEIVRKYVISNNL